MKTSQSDGTLPDESDQLTGFTVSPRLVDENRSDDDSHLKSPRFGADGNSSSVAGNEGGFSRQTGVGH